jgi:hypothetical protein
MRYSDNGSGVTRDSLEFFREHRHRLGEIVEASVRFPGFDDPYNPYLMVLRDAAGDEIALSGCTVGYPGEGPRGAMQVLVESGWPAEQAQQVFTSGRLTLRRDPAPTGCERPRAQALDARQRDYATAALADRRVVRTERVVELP